MTTIFLVTTVVLCLILATAFTTYLCMTALITVRTPASQAIAALSVIILVLGSVLMLDTIQTTHLGSDIVTYLRANV